MGVSSLPWQPRSVNGQVLSKALRRAGPEARAWQEGAAQQVPVHERAARGGRRTDRQEPPEDGAGTNGERGKAKGGNRNML